MMLAWIGGDDFTSHYYVLDPACSPMAPSLLFFDYVGIGRRHVSICLCTFHASRRDVGIKR